MRFPACVVLSLFALLNSPLTAAQPANGNRLAYLDESDPYYVSRTFPKLITPQWIGEPGADAVVVLAIDDMRGHERWEAYLRPILDRLKQIDGRAPVSIMTCQIDPADPHLQTWLREGVSLEVHTYDHPCPLLQGGDFAKAKGTYDRCVDLLSAVPGNRPVAFRMPCCDSKNTPSPRFYAEIFNATSQAGKFLQADSSVFNILTEDDPELPRDVVLDTEKRSRFRKYLPFPSFVNTIENYPYPYVIGRMCWEFPCVVPSDWEAQHVQKPNNPQTVEDLCRALDGVVAKRGVFNLVFHPHGWIRNDQVNELIDHAVKSYGKRVKFLTFSEAVERINKHLLAGEPLRDAQGKDNGVRLVDVDHDGYLDVVIGNDRQQLTRVWQPKSQSWIEAEFPTTFIANDARLGVLTSDGVASVLASGAQPCSWYFERSVNEWRLISNRPTHPKLTAGSLLRDIDGDGLCELIAPPQVFSTGDGTTRWQKLPFMLPEGTATVAAKGQDAGLRLVDLDNDGRLDVVFSNEARSSVHLFESLEKGWSREVLVAARTAPDAAENTPGKGPLPMIARAGTNNGAWFHSGHLWVQNEDTARLPDGVDRRAIANLLRDVMPGAKTPQKSLESIRVRPGFRAQLVAAEPLTQDPIAFAFGADGKLWVVEMGDYPLGIDGAGKHGGNVRYLEDTAGDGVYDRSTLFLADLGYPTGVAPWRKGVLVACAPEIFYAEDTDGDGRADKREVLFTGFGEGNQQHRMNGLKWGMDGWLYCANGDSNGKIRSTKTGQEVDIRGRDFRIKPDEGLLDPQTGASQYGRNRDDWGNWFGCNNSHPAYHFLQEDHYLRRNQLVFVPELKRDIAEVPGAAPIFPQSRTLARFNDLHAANRFTSANSVLVYRDDLFGPEFENNTFVSEPVHNLVHREVMRANGFTFTSRRADDEQQSEFLASADHWFRPTMLEVGPDGALWIADMYRLVIEHPQWIPAEWQRRLDLRAGHDLGRIYRVFPTDHPPRAIPRLDTLSTTQLVAALDSPSGWQRDMVQQLLLWRGDQSALPHLERLAAEAKRPQTRAQALCALDTLGALRAENVLRALGDAHPGVRRQAARLTEPFLEKAGPDTEAVAQKLILLADDADPQAMLQAAYSLGAWPDPRGGAALARLALREENDRGLRAAVLSSVNPANLAAVLAAALQGSPGKPPRVELVEPLVAMAVAAQDSATLAAVVDRLLTPEKEQKLAAWQVAALASVLEAADKQKLRLAALGPGLERLSAIVREARRLARDENAAVDDRVAAVRLLGRQASERDADVAALVELLGPRVPGDLQAAAAEILASVAPANLPELFLAGWKQHGPRLRGQILDALLAREEFAAALLDRLAQKELAAADLDAPRRQRLLTHPSAAIRQRAEQALAGAINANRQRVIDQYLPALATAGDATAGATIFTKRCAVCHKLRGAGHAVGPDLAALTDNSPQFLLTAILDPNRAVESKFLDYIAVTDSGQTFTGMLASETGNSITLVGQEGKTKTILRGELETLQSTGRSLMPEGMEKDLPPQDAAHVIAYLRALMPRKSFPNNKPQLVAAAADGSLRLLAAHAEIYGPSLVFESKYKNLGFWQNAADRAQWSIDAPRAGKYRVTISAACANNSAGNTFIVEAGLQSLTAKATGTGTWDDYATRELGEIELISGPQTISVRGISPLKGALMDLGLMELRPVK